VASRPAPAAEDAVEVTTTASRPRGIQKASADLPVADTADGVIYIRTGRAPAVASATRAAPAMSFKSTADTPEEEAAEVLALLAQAERGPRFVWQMARRPDAG
jgi:hypothetical protein